MASLSVSDLKLAFMAAQLGVSVSSLQDIEKQFYEKYQAGGLSQLGSNNVFTGTNQFNGNIGFGGNAPVAKAAAIAAPTAPGAAYAQAEAQSAVAAINAIRTALTNIGITL